jgi:hypothetical protein
LSLVFLQFIIAYCVWNVKVNDFRKDVSCKTQRFSLCRGLQIEFSREQFLCRGIALNLPLVISSNTCLVVVTVSLSLCGLEGHALENVSNKNGLCSISDI